MHEYADELESRATQNDMDGDEICANCGHEFDHHINPDLTARKCDAEIAAPHGFNFITDIAQCNCYRFEMSQEAKDAQRASWVRGEMGLR